MAKVAVKLDKRENCKRPDGTYPLVGSVSECSFFNFIEVNNLIISENKK